VRAIVTGTLDAIGYISLGYVTDTVKPVSFDGVAPTVENVKAGKYGLQRKLRLLTRQEPTELSKKFINFVLSPEIQEKIVGVEFVPVR
jgi:phosphate transport system substrate-binding protein